MKESILLPSHFSCKTYNSILWAYLCPQVFREQGIDGETLPLLTEEHLLNTMGLKLGPALKIRAQVSVLINLEGIRVLCD